MFKFISKISYSLLICGLLSGCYHLGNTSLHVKNKASPQLIQNTDVILITTSHPTFEGFGIFKDAKERVKSHLTERGYTVVEKNTSIKPNIFVLIEPDLTIRSFEKGQLVCEMHFLDMSSIQPADSYGSSQNAYTVCYNQLHTTLTYIYDYNLTIYRPDTISNNINQYTASKGYKQNPIFSSKTSYKSRKIENHAPIADQMYTNIDGTRYQQMTDAIFATYPMNQNFLVYFQNTPDGYIPTQIIKEQ